MTDPENTLAAIDAAVDGWVGRDYTVSDDAMRSAPQPPSSTTVSPRRPSIAGRVYMAPVGTSADAPQEAWTEVGTLEGGDLVYDLDGDRNDLEQAWHAATSQSMRMVVTQISTQWEGVVRAFAPLVRELAKASETTHAAFAPTIYGTEYRRHRRRCRICNPAGNPKPLKVDGAAYTRRRRNRRRR